MNKRGESNFKTEKLNITNTTTLLQAHREIIATPVLAVVMIAAETLDTQWKHWTPTRTLKLI